MAEIDKKIYSIEITEHDGNNCYKVVFQWCEDVIDIDHFKEEACHYYTWNDYITAIEPFYEKQFGFKTKYRFRIDPNYTGFDDPMSNYLVRLEDE